MYDVTSSNKRKRRIGMEKKKGRKDRREEAGRYSRR
jgi:hypothetical protein